MPEENLNPASAGDAAAITTGEEVVEQPVEQPAGDAAPLGGTPEEIVQPEKPADAIEDLKSKVAEAEKAEPRPSLAEAATRRAEEREKAEEAEKAKADPEPEIVEEKKTEEKPGEDPAKPEADKPEAEKLPEATEEKAEEKADEIKVEDVDKVHEKDSVTARDRIRALAVTRDTLAAELTPLKETLEMLGGQEGVDEILKTVALIEDPSKATEFLALVEKSPNFAAFRDKHFWDELDNPDNQALIVADRFGDGYTMDRLEKLVAFDKKGLIDLDAIEEGADKFTLSDDQIKAKQAENTEAARLRTENAELKKTAGDRQQIEAQEAEVNRWNEFGKGYDGELFPMLEEMGMLPRPDDAPEIVDAKTRHWGTIAAASQHEFETHPEFQEIARLIQAGATDTVTFRNKVRGFKPVYLDITKKAIVKELPFLNGSIEAIYKQTGKAKAAAAGASVPAAPNQNTAKPAAPAAAAPTDQELQTAAPAKATTSYRDSSDRKNAFQKAAEKSAQNRRNG